MRQPVIHQAVLGCDNRQVHGVNLISFFGDFPA